MEEPSLSIEVRNKAWFGLVDCINAFSRSWTCIRAATEYAADLLRAAAPPPRSNNPPQGAPAAQAIGFFG